MENKKTLVSWVIGIIVLAVVVVGVAWAGTGGYFQGLIMKKSNIVLDSKKNPIKQINLPSNSVVNKGLNGMVGGGSAEERGENLYQMGESQHFPGSGNNKTSNFHLKAGLTIIKTKFVSEGESSFSPCLHETINDPAGHCIVNRLGDYNGSIIIKIAEEADYYIDAGIYGDGDWEFWIDQPGDITQAPELLSFSGSGDRVSAFTTLSQGDYKVNYTYNDSESWFDSTYYDLSGKSYNILNEYMQTSGEKTFTVEQSGIYIFGFHNSNINKSPKWTVSLEKL